MIVYQMIGAVGMYVWARNSISPMASFASAIVFSLNGAVASYVQAGHFGIATYATIGWLGWSVSRFHVRSSYGIVAGLALAWAVNTALHYLTAFLVGMLSLYLLWQMVRGGNSRVWWHALLLFIATTLALAGNRLVLELPIVFENQRPKENKLNVLVTPTDALRAALDPWQRDYPWGQTRGFSWHEFGSYVGVPAFLAFAISLIGRPRWFHVVALVALLLSLGNTLWYHPSALVETLPMGSLVRIPTRWRLVLMVALALGVGHTIERLSRSRVRKWAWLWTALLTIDLLAFFFFTSQSIFIIEQKPVREKTRQTIVQWSKNPETLANAWSNIFPTVQQGVGIVDGYEPLIAFQQRGEHVLGQGHPLYRGESANAKIIRWTPNLIQFEALDSNQPVSINQNASSYWQLDGRPLFPKARTVDKDIALSFQPSATKTSTLAIVPPMLPIARIVSAIGVLLFVITLFASTINRSPAKGAI